MRMAMKRSGGDRAEEARPQKLAQQQQEDRSLPRSLVVIYRRVASAMRRVVRAGVPSDHYGVTAEITF